MPENDVPENGVPAGDVPAGRAAVRRSGVLLVDKPAGMTSHDVVSRVRRLASTRKVGHAGTLDPMATGLLVLGLNSSTRLLTFLVGLDKTYLATIRLGAATTTDDAEGEPVTRAAPDALAAVTPEAIRQQMAALTGAIRQVPSSVSAIKVGGRRAYALVRAGESVELPARDVTVSRFELLDAQASLGQRSDGWLDLDVLVECSSGTYVRALARDLGAALGVGGHLTALRRTRIGPFQVTDAAPLDTLDVASTMLHPAAVATRLFPSVQLDAGAVRDLMHGKRVPIDAGEPDSEPYRGPVAALGPDGRLVGLVETLPGGLAKPLVNFPRDEVLE